MDYIIPLVLLTYTSIMALLSLESRSLVYGAISLAGFFIGLSLFFFLLNLPYLGVFQLLVYVGAISVLILFAVMVIGEHQKAGEVRRFRAFGLVGGLLLALAMAFAGIILLMSFLDVSFAPLYSVLVYVAPVVVLITFVVLFVGEPKGRSHYRYRAFGVLGAALIFGSFTGVFSYLGGLNAFSGEVPFDVGRLADFVMNNYGFLMVVLGLLLASAAYGAVALAKKEKEEEEEER